jgi:hypothetical protein
MIHTVNQAELRTFLGGGQPLRVVDRNLQVGCPLHDEHGDLKRGYLPDRIILESRTISPASPKSVKDIIGATTAGLAVTKDKRPSLPKTDRLTEDHLID